MRCSDMPGDGAQSAFVDYPSWDTAEVLVSRKGAMITGSWQTWCLPINRYANMCNKTDLA